MALELELKEGALHEQLGIPKDRKIPVKLLEKIMAANIGDIIEYEVDGKKKKIKVTKLLRKRANFALVARKWKK